MEWGMIMAMFTVVGMLGLIFGQPPTSQNQTFGRDVVNPTESSIPESHEDDVRRAA